MSKYDELKRLAEDAVKGSENWLAAGMLTQLFSASCTPSEVLALITENERLNAENKQLILLECHGGIAQAAANLLAERDQLKAENEALRYDIQVANSVVNAERKDAERYRWLRSTDCWEDSLASSPISIAWSSYGEYVGNSSGVDLDSAVDAAMSKAEQS